MAKNPPAFQYYPDAFDGATKSWTLEEVGLYTRLLNHQWVNGHLPAEEHRLRRIACATSEEFSSAWPAVSVKFELGADGSLRNLRMEKERAKQVQYRERQAAKGRVGGKAKALAAAKPALQPAPERGLSQPSSRKPSRDVAFQSSTSITTFVGEASASPTSKQDVESLLLPPSQTTAVGSTTARAGNGRPPDLLWEAMLEACGLRQEDMTKGARGACNSARKDLGAVGATPEEVRRRAAIYRRKFPGAELTPTALAKQWAQCGSETPVVPPARRGAVTAYRQTEGERKAEIVNVPRAWREAKS